MSKTCATPTHEKSAQVLCFGPPYFDIPSSQVSTTLPNSPLLRTINNHLILTIITIITSASITLPPPTLHHLPVPFILLYITSWLSWAPSPRDRL